MKLFWLAAGAAVGYVLGTKAGRERYEQIRATAHDLATKPAVSDAVDSVTALAGRGKDAVVDKTAELAAKAKDATRPKAETTTTVAETAATGSPAVTKPAST